MNTRPDRGSRARAVAAWLAATIVLVLSGCMGDAGRQRFGEPVDLSAALPLSTVLEAHRPAADGVPAVVKGKIGEVCTTAGCWFALQDVKDGRVYDLLIDLKGGADFTVPQSIKGRPAVVRGKIVGDKPDLKLLAVGLVVE